VEDNRAAGRTLRTQRTHPAQQPDPNRYEVQMRSAANRPRPLDTDNPPPFTPVRTGSRRPATDRQLAYLERLLGRPVDRPLTVWGASDWISALLCKAPATEGQRRFLVRSGLWREDLTRVEASHLISAARADEGRV
jgi:hypothetical protein